MCAHDKVDLHCQAADQWHELHLRRDREKRKGFNFFRLVIPSSDARHGAICANRSDWLPRGPFNLSHMDRANEHRRPSHLELCSDLKPRWARMPIFVNDVVHAL